MTTRRDFLGLTAGAVAAGAVPVVGQAAPVNPDAELIRARYAIGQACAAYEAAAEDSDEKDVLGDEYDRLADIVLTTKATTFAGLRAKAQAAYDRAVQDSVGDEDFASLDGIGALLSWDVVNDLPRDGEGLSDGRALRDCSSARPH